MRSTVGTDNVRDSAVAALLWVCDWEVDREGTVWIVPHLNKRFKDSIIFSQTVGVDIVYPVASCTGIE